MFAKPGSYGDQTINQQNRTLDPVFVVEPSMIEISPVTASYPIKKTTKVIRDKKKQQADKKNLPQHKDDENDDSSNEPIEQHIDEII